MLEAGDVGAGERKGTEELQMEMRETCYARQEGREMWSMGEPGRARPSRDVMLSPKSGPLEEAPPPQSTFLPLPDWGANTCDDEGREDKRQGSFLLDVPLRETVGLRKVLI